MDVAAYIRELLSREHAVYVPGLGTFSKRKIAGVFKEEEQSFYPPKNSIYFVAEEKPDETLENYISKQKNISQDAAKYFLEKFVDQLKSESDIKNIPVKEALFPAEDELVKEKSYTPFNEENFGLPAVNISPIKEMADSTEKSFTDKEAITKQDYVENFYREFSNNLPEEEPKSKRSTSFWAAILLLLLICILGGYALYFYYPNLYSKLFAKKQASEIIAPKPKLDTQQHVPIVEKQITKDTVSTKAAADTISTQPVATVTKPVVKDTTAILEAADPDLVEKSPYEIIGATFKTLKGAKTFLSQLKARGMHHAKILKNTSGKLKLVTFGSFKDKDSATAALEKLRARDPNSDAHIQHYNK